MTIRLLVADDHPVARLGLRTMLAGEPGFQIVAECADGASALERCVLLRPEVALLDLKLPKRSALEVAEALREEAPTVRVVIITGQPNADEMELARARGVLGFLGKDAPQAELVRVLQAAASGQVLFLARPVANPAVLPLSARELEVLQLVASGATNKVVAERLSLSAGTIRVHLSNIFAKLGVETRTEAVSLAVRQGWIVP